MDVSIASLLVVAAGLVSAGVASALTSSTFFAAGAVTTAASGVVEVGVTGVAGVCAGAGELGTLAVELRREDLDF